MGFCSAVLRNFLEIKQDCFTFLLNLIFQTFFVSNQTALFLAQQMDFHEEVSIPVQAKRMYQNN